MVGVGHISSQFYQDRFHGVVSVPVGKAGKLGWINLALNQYSFRVQRCTCTHHSILLVHARQVDLVHELDGWWLVGIFVTTVHL